MEPIRQFTREKHLDHLVRVVPLLCLAYGFQSFMMMSYASGGPTGTLVMLLGSSLAMSVLALVGYDLRHQVQWGEQGFSVKAPWSTHASSFQRSQIVEIEIIGAPEEFQTVVVKLQQGRSLTFYFVDNGHEFKADMEASREQRQAA